MKDFHNFKSTEDGQVCTVCDVSVLDEMPERAKRIRIQSNCPFDPEKYKDYIEEVAS